MKKLIAAILALILVASLVGCGSGGVKSNDIPSTSSNTYKPAQGEVTIEERVLVNEAGVKITAKSLEVEGAWGTTLKLLIENNSKKNLGIYTDRAIVNGYMLDSYSYGNVPSGKKVNEGFTFYTSDMDEYGIDTIADIELNFQIFDSDTYDEYLTTDSIQIKTSAADTYKDSYKHNGDIIYNENGIKIMLKDSRYDNSIQEQGLLFYVENNSDHDIFVHAEDISVNGYMMGVTPFKNILAGKRSVDWVHFYEYELRENDIDKIKEVELYLTIGDCNKWSYIGETDIIRLKF